MKFLLIKSLALLVLKDYSASETETFRVKSTNCLASLKIPLLLTAVKIY